MCQPAALGLSASLGGRRWNRWHGTSTPGSRDTLSCIGSPIPAPTPQAVSESSTLEVPSSAADPAETSSEPTIAAEAETSRPAEDNKTTVAGIPVLHLCVFAGGMVLAIACLVAMTMRGRLKNQPDEDEDDEENSPD